MLATLKIKLNETGNTMEHNRNMKNVYKSLVKNRNGDLGGVEICVELIL